MTDLTGLGRTGLFENKQLLLCLIRFLGASSADKNRRQAPAWGADLPPRIPHAQSSRLRSEGSVTCARDVAFWSSGPSSTTWYSHPGQERHLSSTQPHVRSARPLLGKPLLGKIKQQALSHDKQALSREPVWLLGSHGSWQLFSCCC